MIRASALTPKPLGVFWILASVWLKAQVVARAKCFGLPRTEICHHNRIVYILGITDIKWRRLDIRRDTFVYMNLWFDDELG